MSAGAGTGVVRVDHKKPSAGAVRVRVKNDGSLCSLGQLETLKILVDFTDTPNALRYSGKSPVDLAKEKGHDEIVKFLEDYIKKANKKRILALGFRSFFESLQ